ncbi:hypothetical protein [Cellulosilyticum lentocellum]|uniref:Uncharacterized protein n=1 Tax=Cellulosilyticum lentocellum (strain ATCC 49066 / DSM 5427 / NCIMB 11756 / RHM5) TaxID=642492 RepID=F2JRF7_CELLD|nr:hypothetical protein [Cellulosilyticum lentocellum]ADZ82766.1 hypothetical protein Clole_1034 [Cellulosilyticum lentocellum DSM 5427]
MKIECTKEEFKVLLDMVYAGNILINSMRSQEEKIEEYANMEQFFLSKAKEYGLENIAEYDEEYSEYIPTREYEDEDFNGYIDEYETRVFWEELIMRLARRDALNYAGDVDQDITKAALKEMQFKLEDKYEEEIEANGIMNLKVITWNENNANS